MPCAAVCFPLRLLLLRFFFFLLHGFMRYRHRTHPPVQSMCVYWSVVYALHKRELFVEVRTALVVAGSLFLVCRPSSEMECFDEKERALSIARVVLGARNS